MNYKTIVHVCDREPFLSKYRQVLAHCNMLIQLFDRFDEKPLYLHFVTAISKPAGSKRMLVPLLFSAINKPSIVQS